MAPLSPAEFRVLDEMGPGGGTGEIIPTRDDDRPVVVRLYRRGLVGVDPFDGECACTTARGELAVRVHRAFLATQVLA